MNAEGHSPRLTRSVEFRDNLIITTRIDGDDENEADEDDGVNGDSDRSRDSEDLFDQPTAFASSEAHRRSKETFEVEAGSALWSETNKNRDVSTGPLTRPLAPLTRSLAPDCSLRSRPPLRSLVRSLAHFAHSLARGEVID